MSPKVVIIADDLTGALDTAVPFASRGLMVIAARAPQHFPAALASGADVVALSTGTREGDVQTAKAVLTEIRQILSPHTCIIFKKIDSRMKGHIFAETEILATLRPGKALVCPAIPRLGRCVENGSIIGAGVDAPIAIAPFFGALAVDIVDAKADADLDRAISGASEAQLFVGAAGLAAALARRIAPKPAKSADLALERPALLAIGSRDPVTIAQVDALAKAALAIRTIKATNGILPDVKNHAEGISMVQMTSGDIEIGTALASRNFAQGVAPYVHRMRPKTLFACGGESANAILENLGIGLLQVEGEILPGVPCATARDGMSGLTILTKSGGFGDPQTLVALCGALQIS